MIAVRALALGILVLAAPAAAAEKEAPVGYGGATVQMAPIMAPYRTSAGIRYEVLTIRIVLDTGPRERPACFTIPIVHDRILRFLYHANLTSADFVGERRSLLAQRIFDVAVATTGRGYYSSAQLIGDDPEELDPKSQTLSTQCK